MTITINNLTASNNAPAGTIIGMLTTQDALGNPIPCNYTLTKGSAGHFAISDNKLVTEWSMSTVPGYYSIRVHAIGISTRFSGSATFTVTVGASAPPPPPPAGPSITMNGSTNVNVVEGANLT